MRWVASVAVVILLVFPSFPVVGYHIYEQDAGQYPDGSYAPGFPDGTKTHDWTLGSGSVIVCEQNSGFANATLFPTGASLGDIVMDLSNDTYYLADDTTGGALGSPSPFEPGEPVHTTVTGLPVVGDDFGPFPVLSTPLPANAGEGGLCFISPGDGLPGGGANQRSNGTLPDGTDASGGITAAGVPDSDVYVNVSLCGNAGGGCNDLPFLAQGGSFGCDVEGGNFHFVYNEMFLYWDNGGHVEAFVNTTAAPPTTGSHTLTDGGSEPAGDRCHDLYPVWTSEGGGTAPPREKGSAFQHPESITGTTPFSGGETKPLFPCKDCCCHEAGSVNVASGEFLVQECVLSIPTDRGPPVCIQVTYRSGVPVDPPLGFNWDHNYNKYLEELSSGDVARHNGGLRNDTYTLESTGAYASPPGFYDDLTKNADGSFTLRNRHGTVEEYDAGGRLTEILDRNGNELAFTYNGAGLLTSIVDAQDRQITLTYNADGFIDAVTDFDGRSVTFSYNTDDDLESITTPLGETTSFTYSDGHELLSITDPEGNTYLENTYDPQRRVTGQEYGGGNYTFSYSPGSPSTTVTDRNGNTVVWTYKSLQEPVPLSRAVLTNRDIRPDDPPAYVTTYAHNADLELTRVTHPRGNSQTFVYDAGATDSLQRGNLLAHTQDPGPVVDPATGTPAAPITTTYTYDPLFNQVKTVVSARGNDPAFVPPNLGPGGPLRYTTTYIYDHEEPLLGDVNGDGTTSQAGGNVVKVVRPTVNPFAAPHPEFTSGYEAQVVEELYTYNGFGQVLSHVDPEGNVEKREYFPSNGNSLDASDHEGYLKKVTRDTGTGTDPNTGEPRLNIVNEYTYDEQGNVLSFKDGRGNTVTYEVDDRNRVTKQTERSPLLYEVLYTYDGNDNTIQKEVQDTGSVFFTHTYAYDELDNLATETLDASRPAGAPSSSQPTSLVTKYHYDRSENLVLVRHPEAVNGNQPNNVESYVYDERDLVATHTRGGVTAQFSSLAANGGIDTAGMGIAGSPDQSTVAYAYDGNGNRASFTDGTGDVTRFAHDGFDRRTSTTDALGNVFTTAYDPESNVVARRAFGPIDGQGQGSVLLAHSVHHFDESGREYRTDQAYFDAATGNPLPDGALLPGDGFVSSLTEFDAKGRAVQTVNDNAHHTTMVHDGADRLHLSTDELGNTVAYAYDGNDNLVETVETEKDPAGNLPDEVFTTNYTYDNVDRVIEVEDPIGNVQEYAYDSRDNVVTETDGEGNTVDHVYDGIDRLWADDHDLRAGGTGAGSVTDTIRVAYEYDGDGRLTKMTDDNGNPTTYAHDDLGRVSVETFADSTTNTFAYDRDDNTVRKVDEAGNRINMTYDPLDRLVLRVAEPVAGFVGSTVQAFEYDGLSRLTSTLDNNDPLDASDDSLAVQHYDSLGRVVREVQNGQEVASVRDGVGNRLSLTYPNGRTLAYTYDALERLDQVIDTGSALADYDYMGPGRVLTRTLGNGAVLEIGYDGDRRITEYRHEDALGSLLVGFEYTYDREDNRLSQLKQHVTGESELYAYDSLYRVEEMERGTLNAGRTAVATPSTGLLQKQEWSYDGVGNWLNTTRTTSGSPVLENRTHNAMNELSSQETGGAATPLSYDDNGNLLDDGELEYRWDFQNRLREVVRTSDGAQIAEYEYDALGRRTQKTVTNMSVELNGTTLFVYDGWREIQDTGGPAGVLLQQYVHGPRYIDEVLAMDRVVVGAAPLRVYYHEDAMYSVHGLSDASGVLSLGYVYDAFGSHTLFEPGANGTVDFGEDDVVTVDGLDVLGNPFGFTGRRLDGESGQAFFRARNLEPSLGRFISRDPAGGWLDFSNVGNPYSFTSNNPLGYLDPQGLFSMKNALGCCDKCDEKGLTRKCKPLGYSVTPAALSPEDLERALNTARNLGTLQTIDQLGGLIKTGIKDGLRITIAEYVANEVQPSLPSPEQFVKAWAEIIGKRFGYDMYVKVGWEQCEEEDCRFWTRLNWQQEETWYRCNIGSTGLVGGGGGTYQTKADAAKALGRCIARAYSACP